MFIDEKLTVQNRLFSARIHLPAQMSMENLMLKCLITFMMIKKKIKTFKGIFKSFFTYILIFSKLDSRRKHKNQTGRRTPSLVDSMLPLAIDSIPADASRSRKRYAF